jgi:hypothetical protein
MLPPVSEEPAHHGVNILSGLEDIVFGASLLYKRRRDNADWLRAGRILQIMYNKLWGKKI